MRQTDFHQIFEFKALIAIWGGAPTGILVTGFARHREWILSSFLQRQEKLG